MEHGKTIELFLVNGTADSLVTAELSNWSGKALRIPRGEVATCTQKEMTQPGVYFLFCKDDDNNDAVYIGESENVKDRLIRHMRDYDNEKEKYYWTTAVIFFGRDLDKAHIRYLEYRLADMATKSGRYKLLTKSTYGNTVLKPSQIAVLEEFIDYVKVIINTLGYKVLEPLREEKVNNNLNKMLYLEAKDVSAKGIVTNEGFVLLSGAKVKKDLARSCSDSVKKLRVKYQKEGKLVDYVTKEDLLFASSTGAAGFVQGFSVSGPQAWKNKDGVTLKEIEARKLAAEDSEEE